MTERTSVICGDIRNLAPQPQRGLCCSADLDDYLLMLEGRDDLRHSINQERQGMLDRLTDAAFEFPPYGLRNAQYEALGRDTVDRTARILGISLRPQSGLRAAYRRIGEKVLLHLRNQPIANSNGKPWILYAIMCVYEKVQWTP